MRQKRGQPRLGPDAHLKKLRWAVVGVAAFAWCFSMVFPLQEYISMYFQITGAIFTGGAGAVLIGGLYWRRGNTSAAWSAMIAGSTLTVLGVVLIDIVWPIGLPALQSVCPQTARLQNLPEAFLTPS
ncbi:MAG: hypothetical protein AAF593_00435 [Planctomycetota bacterium]